MSRPGGGVQTYLGVVISGLVGILICSLLCKTCQLKCLHVSCIINVLCFD